MAILIFLQHHHHHNYHHCSRRHHLKALSRSTTMKNLEVLALKLADLWPTALHGNGESVSE